MISNKCYKTEHLKKKIVKITKKEEINLMHAGPELATHFRQRACFRMVNFPKLRPAFSFTFDGKGYEGEVLYF